MFDFTEQVVMLTGSAGYLGRAVARAFQRSGAHLVLIDRSVGRLAEIFPELADLPDHHFAEGIDLTDSEAVEKSVTETMARFGKINGLINIAGGFRMGSVVQAGGLETWDFMFKLNTRTVLLTSRAVLPYMQAQKTGKIVNVAARAALAGNANLAAYSASKSAVLRLSESLAAEYKEHGININCVLPSAIDTPKNRQSMPNADFSKWLAPEAIADVILFLTSDAARSLHGVSIPL